MNIAHKALYNSLRMHPDADSLHGAASWKIEDLRGLSTDLLFDRLKKKGISLEKQSFLHWADECDNPEDLIELLLGKEELTPPEQDDYDQVYLVLFELWRRLLPEKSSISIIADELDYQIHLRDLGKLETNDPLFSALRRFYSVLEEHIDHGMDPAAVFDGLAEYCAHDIPSFLYDFIGELIDIGDDEAADELLEQFSPLISDKKWFRLLKARLLIKKSPKEGNLLVLELFQNEMKRPNLEFLLELLSGLSLGGDKELFLTIAEAIFRQNPTQADLLDLVEICTDFFYYLDDETREHELVQLSKELSEEGDMPALSKNDPRLKRLASLLASARS